MIHAGEAVAYEEQGVATDMTATEGKEERPASEKRQGDIGVFDLTLAKAHWLGPKVKALAQLLQDWENGWEKVEKVGRTHAVEHAIETGQAHSIAMPLRRITWIENDQIRKEVSEVEEQGVVVDSSFPWASPPVFVRKQDGTMRFCIDYQKLNAAAVPDQYPLPRNDDVLDAQDTGSFFSVIDLKAGYWQIPMKKQDAEKTTFRTADGLFHFTVMPFGLGNAPATFQRMMDVLFSGLKWKGLLVSIILSENNQCRLSAPKAECQGDCG